MEFLTNLSFLKANSKSPPNHYWS